MPNSPISASEKRSFSELSHTHGKWDTRISVTANPVVRAVWNFCSFKRSGVHSLASRHFTAGYILDLGCGSGAYSHWFLGRKPGSRIIAVDWSVTALKKIPGTKRGVIIKVCADVQCLPFKPQIFDTLFSVDTLGHLPCCEKALDETLRVARNGANLFLHSECSDYRYRWPDAMLIRKNRKDSGAEFDGHISLKTSEIIHHLYNQRFHIQSFFSPAGFLGWLIGYPEKYAAVFRESHDYFWYGLTRLFALIKKMPGSGIALRMINATANRIELFLGLYGGGSCFAELEKHQDTIFTRK